MDIRENVIDISGTNICVDLWRAADREQLVLSAAVLSD
jgi:hypothetical protein